MDSMLQFVFDYLKDNHAASWFYHIVSVLIFSVAGIKIIVWPLVLFIYNKYIDIKDFFIGIRNTITTVDWLKKELQPNGGSTIKDSINRIDKEVKDVKHLISYSCAKQGVFFDFLGYSEDGLGLFESNELGECIYASPKYYEITGCTEVDVKGNGWVNLIDESDRDRVFTEWQHCIAQKRPFILDYDIIHKKTHEIIRVNCYAKPLIENNKIHGYIGGLRKLSCPNVT